MKYPSDVVTVTTPSKVPRSTIHHVTRFMLTPDIRQALEDKGLSADELLKDPDWDIYTTKNGRWHTRLKRALHKAAGIKLDAKLLSNIGEMVDRRTLRGRSFTMFFANAMTPAEFDASFNDYEVRGIRGWTCWREKYNENYYLSKRFFLSRGVCIRLYKDEKAWNNNPWEGIGRAFCIEQDNRLLLFNIKGDLVNREELSEAVRILFGFEHRDSCNIIPPEGYLDNSSVLYNGDHPGSPLRMRLKELKR